MSAFTGTLFDLAPVKPERRAAGIDRDALANIGLLYTATEKGNNSGVRFAMSLDDARAWCSSDVSSGVLHGTRWAYFWTSALNFIECHWGTDDPVFDFSKEHDDGSWDERIAALGLTKYGFAEMADLLRPLGVTVITPKGSAS